MREASEKLRQMARAYVLGGLVLSLSACGALREPAAVSPVLVADKPVYWCPAVTVAKPAFAVDSMPLGLDVYDQMKHLRAERLQRQAYELELEAALRGRNEGSPQ